MKKTHRNSETRPVANAEKSTRSRITAAKVIAVFSDISYFPLKSPIDALNSKLAQYIAVGWEPQGGVASDETIVGMVLMVKRS
jgi:hypothetical protein